jgi:two-component sensor histidine kinase
VIVDITDARKAETHQRLLINELNHRVKNTLATVQSIAYQTLREGMVSKDARELFTSRLLALSAAHNVLTRENWEAAEIAEITAEAIRPYIDDESRRISLEGPPARVGPTVALAISMALHELATNAAKYGALSGAAGRVTIVWRAAGDTGVEVSWRESGGPPVAKPTRRGFGSRLLTQGLAAELGMGAQLNFEPTGLVCLINAPVLNRVMGD